MNQKVLLSTCCAFLLISVIIQYSRIEKILLLILENENLKMSNENMALEVAIKRVQLEQRPRSPIGFHKS